MSSSYSDPLSITPYTRPVSGTVKVPGSKSITNRMMILACMASHPVKLTGALFSDDSRLMITGLSNLGFGIETDETAQCIRVSGTGGRIASDNAELYVGVAGSAA